MPSDSELVRAKDAKSAKGAKNSPERVHLCWICSSPKRGVSLPQLGISAQNWKSRTISIFGFMMAW